MPCACRLDRGERPRPLDDGLGACQISILHASIVLRTRVRGCSPRRPIPARTVVRRPSRRRVFDRARKSVKHAGTPSRGHRAWSSAPACGQRREIVDRVEDQRCFCNWCVRRDDPPFRNEHDAIDVALDGPHPVGEGPRDAVAMQSKATVWYLSTSTAGSITQGSTDAWAGARRGEVLGQTGLDQERTEEDCTVRSRSASQHLRKTG